MRVLCLRIPVVVLSALLILHVVVDSSSSVRKNESPSATTFVLSDSCTAVIQEISSSEGVKSTQLLCQTSKGLFYHVPHVQSDWIKQRRKDKQLYSGKTMLDIPFNATINAETQTLQLDGQPKLVNNIMNMASKGETTGTRRVLAIRVQATTVSPTVTEEQLSDSIFGTYGDRVNLVSQYSACSHGKLQFEKVPDRKGVSSNIVNGVVTLKVDTPVSQGDIWISNAVSQEIFAQFGILPMDIADHVIYCMPPGAMKSEVGRGWYDGWYSALADTWCLSASATIHEIGHNLGLYHSGKGLDEYADISCLMGRSWYHSEIPLMCFNAAKNFQLGWYSDKVVSYTPGANGKYSWSGKLGGIVDYNTSTNPVIVQIPRFNEEWDIYIGFNVAKGFNSGVIEGRNQVLVFENERDDDSYRVGDLNAGQSYSSNNFDGIVGDTLKIIVNSIDYSSNVADITISLEGPSVRLGLMTSSPSSNPTAGPSSEPKARSCQSNYDQCRIDSDCCPGFTCRRISPIPEISKVCRRLGKNSKDKLARKTSYCRGGIGGGCVGRRRLRGNVMIESANKPHMVQNPG